jgi:hypothetical protein
MAVIEPTPIERPSRLEDTADEERQDHLDYCAAGEALDEFLQDREVTPLEDFIRELGLGEDFGV